MKIVIAIFFMATFTNVITAETCNEVNIRHLKDVKISKIKKQKYYAECLFKEKRDEGYWEWRESVTWGSKDAYYLQKNTIACHTRERAIKAYNYVQENPTEGRFDSSSIKLMFDTPRLVDLCLHSFRLEQRYRCRDPYRYHQKYTGPQIG